MVRRAFVFWLIMAMAAYRAMAADDVVFQTDWKAQAEHGGFYQAVALGFYQDEGVTVRIRAGGPQIDIPRLMAAGAIDYGMASNSFQPINLVAAGAGTKVVMTTFQRDPQVMMLHADDAAVSLAELVGRPIFISDSGIPTIWGWLKRKYGYQDRQIRKYTYSLAPWLANPGSVQEGYVTSEPFAARKAGQNPKLLLLADADYPGYAGMVMVSEAERAANPDRVEAFVRASVRGWISYLYDDPRPGNALILKDNPDMTQDWVEFSHQQIKQYDLMGKAAPFGAMTMQRWQQFYSEMASFGAVPGGVDLARVFTNQFLPTDDRE